MLKDCIILMVNFVCIIELIFYKKRDLIFTKVYYILEINDFVKRKIILNYLYQNDTNKKLNSFFQNN